MRSRGIKPGFYKNEDLAECSVWARLLFPGLWMMADREGRLEDRPKRIKGEVLPYDTVDVEPLLDELADRKFLIRYEIEGDRFIEITGFKAHQSPHFSEKPSVIPAPNSGKSAVSRQSDSGKAGASSDQIPKVVAENSGKTPSSRGGRNPLTPDCGLLTVDDAAFPAAPRPKASPACPKDVSDQTWTDWLTLRRSKKAPVTATVLDGARAEAQKAGMSLDAFLREWVLRGSQGLKAEWLTNRGSDHKPPRELGPDGKPLPEWAVPGMPIL